MQLTAPASLRKLANKLVANWSLVAASRGAMVRGVLHRLGRGEQLELRAFLDRALDGHASDGDLVELWRSFGSELRFREAGPIREILISIRNLIDDKRFERVEKILRTQWNPQGLTDAGRAEKLYDEWTAGMAGHVIEGSTPQKIADRIVSVEEHVLHVPPNPERARRVAEQLVALRQFERAPDPNDVYRQ